MAAIAAESELSGLPSADETMRVVDEQYLEHYVRQAIRARPGEQNDAVLQLVQSLRAKCKENAVFYEDQLQSLSHLGKLNDVLGCVMVSSLITEEFDNRVAIKRSKKPIRSWFYSLAGSLQAMEAMCVNYGVCSALVLTMTFANFGSITNDDWDEYMINVQVPAKGCLSSSTCADNSICKRALHLVVAEPWTNLSATDPPMACCNEVIQCAEDALFWTDLGYTLGNGGGSACLLLDVLFSSWLYIALYATKVNRNRWLEVKRLTSRLNGEFLILQGTFVVGMVLAGIGNANVMIVKVTDDKMSWVSFGISMVSGLLFIFMLSKICIEITKVNSFVDKLRANQEKYASESSRYSNAFEADEVVPFDE